MKKLLLLFLLILPKVATAQMFGVGAQWSEFDRINFNTTLSCPYKTNIGDKLTWSLGSRIDYVSGNPKVSGLNVKPLSFDFTTSDFYLIKPVTILVGADAGYNFNFNHGNSGIVLTPLVYLDYTAFYIKFGYDYNTFENEGNFFVRFVVGIGQGLLKKISF